MGVWVGANLQIKFEKLPDCAIVMCYKFVTL